MKKFLPVEELARDERFVRVPIEERFMDKRKMPEDIRKQGTRFEAQSQQGPENARGLMHGIMMGEVQALEGAGRTAFDFADDEDTPYELRLDMARQCWDEARHVEISMKLMEHMGVEVGEFSESTFLYEAACNPDPVLRLTGVNRGLEGLAIDIFTSMRAFGQDGGDPIMEYCEDFMLADEVTHVKMGSNWLRRLTEGDKERLDRALEFQRVIDGLFSLGGLRGDDDESPIKLARDFRRLAGFTDEEIEGVAEQAHQVAVNSGLVKDGDADEDGAGMAVGYG